MAPAEVPERRQAKQALPAYALTLKSEDPLRLYYVFVVAYKLLLRQNVTQITSSIIRQILLPFSKDHNISYFLFIISHTKAQLFLSDRSQKVHSPPTRKVVCSLTAPLFAILPGCFQNPIISTGYFSFPAMCLNSVIKFLCHV